MKRTLLALYWICIPLPWAAFALPGPDKEYKVFQFPKDQIPRIDGEFLDWEMVPDSYAIGLDELSDTEGGLGTNLDPNDFNIEVKVGWVKDLDRLYFYLKAEDDYWNFDHHALSQDIFELVIDGDMSGGTFIKRHSGNKNKLKEAELHFKGHGAHAQNYHIFTPVQNKDWVMVWGNTPWIKDFPHYNAAYDYHFQHGESGQLKMEFWITPFDHASIKGFDHSIVSDLEENDVLGLSWCVIDYDASEKWEAFMNLAHDTRMIYDASYLCVFRLMPLEEKFQKPIQSDWSFVEIDRKTRWIQFKDKSYGKIEKWNWDFGDGTHSTEQHPMHQYSKAGEWTVILTVEGPAGKSILSKVWDVVTQ